MTTPYLAPPPPPDVRLGWIALDPIPASVAEAFPSITTFPSVLLYPEA